MRKTFTAVLLILAIFTPYDATHLAAFKDATFKLDSALKKRQKHTTGRSRVIVRAASGVSPDALEPLMRLAGGAPGRRLPGIKGQVVVLPNSRLKHLAEIGVIESISLDREVVGVTERTGATVGADLARQQFGFDGAGIGVAIIDSGITPWHDDLTNAGAGQRVAHFADFVEGSESPRDDVGHGTHVAGIVAGNGFDSDGARTGLAPASQIVALRVLDGTGRGYISDVIAAIDYAIAHRGDFNIRVINLSIAAGVYESYTTDPLTLAARRAVEAGIVVVAAAGNNGRTLDGRTQYGGITAPGNAPWVLTVGASSHMGTVGRADDTIAAFTSRGPTAIDYRAKPDIVAPGVGIESLSTPESLLYESFPSALLPGTRQTTYLPYLSLSGTSMSTPVVTGTVALMLHANPALTPNQVKAILQYTAETRGAYDPLTQGTGFLNAKGAIELARHLGASATVPYPDSTTWSRRLVWGNRLVTGGRLTAEASAWSTSVRWGASTSASGHSVSWGVRCVASDCLATSGSWRYSNTSWTNVVWGSVCGGADCGEPWTIEAVTTAGDGETVVWGTGDGETVVWGTDDGETVVWGTSCPGCTPFVWDHR
jgi:serine protease AprX